MPMLVAQPVSPHERIEGAGLRGRNRYRSRAEQHLGATPNSRYPCSCSAPTSSPSDPLIATPATGPRASSPSPTASSPATSWANLSWSTILPAGSRTHSWWWELPQSHPDEHAAAAADSTLEGSSIGHVLSGHRHRTAGRAGTSSRRSKRNARWPLRDALPPGGTGLHLLEDRVGDPTDRSAPTPVDLGKVRRNLPGGQPALTAQHDLVDLVEPALSLRSPTRTCRRDPRNVEVDLPGGMVSTDLGRVPLRTLVDSRPAGGAFFSCPGCSVIFSFNAVSNIFLVVCLSGPSGPGQGQGLLLRKPDQLPRGRAPQPRALASSSQSQHPVSSSRHLTAGLRAERGAGNIDRSTVPPAG